MLYRLGMTSLGIALISSFSFAEVPVTQFDKMMVIATKTEKKLFDIAGSASEIGLEELNQLQAEKLGDIFKTTPSVEIAGGPRRVAEKPNIRGFGQTKNVIRIDGARQNFSFGHNGSLFIDPELIAQVDVIRGAQSNLHGSGAIGGVMGFRTLDAKDFLRKGENWGAKEKIGFASNQREYLSSSSLYGRYEDKVDGLASFVLRNDHDVKSGKNKKLRFSSDEIRTGLIKANGYLADAHKISASYLIFKDKTPTLSTPNLEDAKNLDRRLVLFGLALSQDTNFPVIRNLKQQTGTIGYEYNNPDNRWVDLKAKFYRTKTDMNDEINNDILPHFKRYDKTHFGTNGFDIYNTTSLLQHDDFAQRITYGIEFYRDDQKAYRNGVRRLTFPKAHGSSTGLYLRQEMTFLKRFIFATGYRNDNYSAHPSSDLKLKKNHAHKGSPSASFTVKPWDFLMGYVSYSQAFRAPQLSELYGGGLHFAARFPNFFIPNPDLSPETARTKEAGLGISFDNLVLDQDKLRAKAAFFVTNCDNFIEREVRINQRIPALNFTSINNVMSARIKGFEFESSYSSNYAFAMFGFSALNGYDKSFSSRLASVPPAKFAFTLGSKLPEIDAQLGWRAVFNKKQNRIPNRQTEEVPTLKTHGYATHDVFLSWLPQKNWAKGMEFNIGVDNLFSKYYRRHLSNLPEMGRNFKISLGYKL